MAVRLKDSTGKVVAEFDHEPSQQEIDDALQPTPSVGAMSDEEWNRMRAMVTPPEEQRAAAATKLPAMAPPPEEPSIFAEGRKPYQPRDVWNALKAEGAAVAEVSSIPFQAINEALAKDKKVGAVEEATRRAFPRGKEWEDKGQGYQSAQDLVMALPNMIRSGMEGLKEFSPSAAENVSAAGRPFARAGFGAVIDPRTWLLAFMPAGAVTRVLGAGFTIDMLTGGIEEQKRAQEILRKEGLTPDAIEALSGAALNYGGAGLLGRAGVNAEMRLRQRAGKTYIDPETGHIMRPIERVTKEGTVEEPLGLPVGEPIPPSPADVVDAEVLAREGVREPARQLERGPLITPWEYPDSAAADTGFYPRPPGAPAPGEAPIEAEVVPPPPPVEPEIPTPAEASPPLKAAIQRFKGNSPNFLRWLNRLEKAAKVTQDPAAMALVQEAKKWQAWQVVMQAQGGFAGAPEGPGVAPAAPGPPTGPGGPVEPAVLPPTTPPPAPGQPFTVQPPPPAGGVAPQPQPPAAPPAPAGAPPAPAPTNEMQPPPGEEPAQEGPPTHPPAAAPPPAPNVGTPAQPPTPAPPPAAPPAPPTEEMQPPPLIETTPLPPEPPGPPTPAQLEREKIQQDMLRIAAEAQGIARPEEITPPPEGLLPAKPERFRASIDIPATPEGLAKFRGLAEKIAAHGGLDEIYHDDQTRTLQSAEVLHELMPEAKVASVGMAGQSQALGKWEGQPVDEKSLAQMRHFVENPDLEPTGQAPESTRPGESFNAYLDRFLPLVDELKKRAESEGKAIGLITHNRNIQTINARLAEAGSKKLYGRRVDTEVMNAPGPETSTINKVIDHATEDWSERPISPGLYLIRHAATAFNPDMPGLEPEAPTLPAAALPAAPPELPPSVASPSSLSEEITPPPTALLAPGGPPPLAPSLDPQVAEWMADIDKLEQLRKTVPAGPDHYAEREHFRNAINAIKQKMDRFEKRQNKQENPELFTVLENQPLSALPKGDPGFFRALMPGTIEAHEPALPAGRPDGWTPEHENALAYMQIDAAVREATGKGGNKLQRQKLSVLRAALMNNMHASFTPDVLEKARGVIDQALKIRHLGDLLQPGVEVPGRHLRLGLQGPRVKVVEVLPSGVDFVVEGRAGERQTVSIDDLSGKNFQPYEEMAAESTMKVAQELYEKSVSGTRKGELGAAKPGALLGLLGMAVATPLAIAFPAETMGAALLAGIGASLVSSRIRNSSVAAWSLARATAAGRLSVAALNGAAAIGRVGLGALSDAAGYVGSMLIPGRRSAEFRQEAEERIKAAVKSLNLKEGLHEVLVGTAAAAQYDPKLWNQISRINPALATKMDSYLNSQLSEDFAWKEIMEMAGVPRADAERFHHFTQGHVDQKTIDRIGRVPAEMVSGMLVWNAAVDRVTRNAYVSIALAPIMKKYGVESLAELRDKIWRVDAEGKKHMLIPAEEYKDVEYAIDTAVTGAMNYSGGLTAEKVHLWRWMDPAIRAISALPLPIAMVLSPNVALFANYALANVPEVLLQHSPLFFLAPRFRASMEARGIQDRAYAAKAELDQLDEEWRAAKDFFKMEAKRNAGLRNDPDAYEEAMSNAQEWVDDAKEARTERGPDLLKKIREWRTRRRSRYYNKQQIYGAFFASSLWLTAFALAYRLMRDEDGTAPLEIRTEKDEKGKSTVIDLKRLLGPLSFSYWLGDMAGRMHLNNQDPNKFANVTQWMHFPDIAKGLQDAMGYRNSPMDSLTEDLNLGTPEGVDKAIRTVVTQVGRLYSGFGGWVHDIYSAGEAAVHGLPPYYQDPMIEPTAMPPIPAGAGAADVTKIIASRAGGAVARTMLPDWFGDLQAKMGVPDSRRVHVADSWDKLLMERRPLMKSPLSWFFTMREQSALTRFMNDVQGAKLADILPSASKVEWYDTIVNAKIAELAKDDDLFRYIEDDSIPPPERWQGVVDRMQGYRLIAHATAKRYADEHNLLLPNAAAFSEAARRDEMRSNDPDYLIRKIQKKATPGLYNLTPYEQRQLGEGQRELTDDLEINLPPYDLDGPPVQ